MEKIKESEIVSHCVVCPYCMTICTRHDGRGHCGESSAHYADAVETETGEIYLLDEIEITKGI